MMMMTRSTNMMNRDVESFRQVAERHGLVVNVVGPTRRNKRIVKDFLEVQLTGEETTVMAMLWGRLR